MGVGGVDMVWWMNVEGDAGLKRAQGKAGRW